MAEQTTFTETDRNDGVEPDTVEIAPAAAGPAPEVQEAEPLPADLEAEDPEDHFMADDDMRGGRDGTTH
mgnify:CR=1 FL=1